MNVIEVLCEDAEDVTAHYDPQFSREQHRTHLCSSPFLVSCCHLILVCLILSPLLLVSTYYLPSSHLLILSSPLISSHLSFFSFLILSRPLFSLSRLSALILLVCLFSDLLSSCIVSSLLYLSISCLRLSSLLLFCLVFSVLLFVSFCPLFSLHLTLSEKKVQKLSLGLYLFKRYTFVHFGTLMVNIST